MTEKIRRAIPEDAADITDMIHGLAEFERAAERMHRHRNTNFHSTFR